MPNATAHTTSTASFAGGTRLIGGLMLLMVLGANLETGSSGRWSHTAREHAAQELAGARRMSERVARAFWTLVGRHDAKAAPSSPAGPVPQGRAPEAVVIMPSQVPATGIEPGVWLLDLPPPMTA